MRTRDAVLPKLFLAVRLALLCRMGSDGVEYWCRAGGSRAAHLGCHDVCGRPKSLQDGPDYFGMPGVRFFQAGFYVFDNFLPELHASVGGKEYRRVVEAA